jgi:thymidylate synthase (FAD)
MGHLIIPAAEEVLDVEFPVLNKGFVTLIDYMGGDQRIARAARVSRGVVIDKTVKEDTSLINSMKERTHTTPFEQVILVFHCKLPIFVARQWIRHRTARVNEMSGRYSIMKDEFYLPANEDIKYQSKTDKQGRDKGEVPEELQEKVLKILKRDQSLAYENYMEMINDGISKELARIDLPLSLYTQWYWQCDLHNLFHFLKLRLDSHAQKEIRVYADIMADMAKRVAPIAYTAFEEYDLYAVTLSRTQKNILITTLEDLMKYYTPDGLYLTQEADIVNTLKLLKGE